MSGLFFCLSVNADCKFKSRVSPNEEYEKVKQIYEKTCLLFNRLYKTEFDSDIVLGSVSFIKNWNKIKDSKDMDKEKMQGLFVSGNKKKINKIWIRTIAPDDFFDSEDLIDSFIVHELVHFFNKRADFDLFSGHTINRDLIESIAYYVQNEYLKAHTGKGLLDHMKHKKDFSDSVINTFPYETQTFLFFDFYEFLHHSVLWMDQNPAKKYKNIMSSAYLLDHDAYAYFNSKVYGLYKED